ncbi:MAG: U32 family peptidase [Bacilli bacterium]|nr:U32 family peptidase [Bacilli bacterium]
MNNIIVSLPTKENFKFFSENKIDGFAMGIENFSENFNHYIKESNLKKVIDDINKNNHKVYIMLNKLYFNNQIDDLKKLLKKLSKLNIEAIIFSDIAVFNIVKENNLDIKLIWHSKMVTNSKSINFYEKRGLYGYIITPQITLDEFIKITKNTNSKAIIKLFGYTNMATSSRSLITNYFNNFNINKDSNKKYYMYEKITKEFYPIVESDYTNFFSSKVLNGIMEYKKLINNNIDCMIYLDDYMINENSFYNIIEAFVALKNHPNDEAFAEKLKKVIDSNMFNETDNGFLNNKTIYKVKKDE